MKKSILITGGAGFIGCHVVSRFVPLYPDYKIVNLDALTYAGNLENLKGVEGESNYIFAKGDVTDSGFIDTLFGQHKFDAVIHLAAESHVDRSMIDPMAFVMTNIVGTVTLLNAARKHWGGSYENKVFYHVSTDEVYGSLGETGLFTENTAYDPKSPYSASKASSDHLVRAYHNTYGLPIVISNCSNNYGPNQFPEKLIPLVINNMVSNVDIPVYGNGENVRDWLYVKDHASAIDTIFHNGVIGETYNIGGDSEWTNIALVRKLCEIMDRKMDKEDGTFAKLITFVKDRAGHDLRYAIDSSKLKDELGWKPSLRFEEGIEKTVDWYLSNREWMSNVVSGEYVRYYDQQYKKR